MNTARRAIVTIGALLGATELLSRHLGADYVLPPVWVRRFAGLAGVDEALLTAQLHAARSFHDQMWSAHWRRIIQQHTATAESALASAAAATGTPVPSLGALLADDNAAAVAALSELLTPAAHFLASRGPQTPPRAADSYLAGRAGDISTTHAVHATNALLKLIGYGVIAAWPGWSPCRTSAYRRSRRLLEAVLRALAPTLGIQLEPLTVETGEETVRGYIMLPCGNRACPVVLTVNGVDGTIQELLLAFLRYPRRGLAVVAMEIPGSWDSRMRMTASTTQVFDAVLRELAEHPRIDANRIAMLGLSFGGYWTASVATTSRLLRCAVVVGAPTDRSFGPSGVFGVPEVMIDAMRKTLGASSNRDLGVRLRQLSLRGRYQQIPIPLLVVDGDADTIVSVRDSRDLAAAAPYASLRLYPGDDHCAIGNFADWIGHAEQWLWRNLTG